MGLRCGCLCLGSSRALSHLGFLTLTPIGLLFIIYLFGGTFLGSFALPQLI